MRLKLIDAFYARMTPRKAFGLPLKRQGASDTLVNLVANDPNVITTGPATLNPDTGEPWGMDFPVVTIRDFVEVQHALLESQGIESLHAVMGASMGALQAIKQTLDDIAAARAALSDANHLLYLVRANQTFMAWSQQERECIAKAADKASDAIIGSHAYRHPALRSFNSSARNRLPPAELKSKTAPTTTEVPPRPNK